MRSTAVARIAAVVALAATAALAPHNVARADDPPGTQVCGTLPAGTTTWTASTSPYVVCDSGVTVGPGSTLTMSDDSSQQGLDVDGGPIDIEGGAVSAVVPTSLGLIFGGYTAGGTPDNFGFEMSEQPGLAATAVSQLTLSGVEDYGYTTAAGNAVVDVAHSYVGAPLDLAGHARAALDSDQSFAAQLLHLSGNASALLTRTSIQGGAGVSGTPAIQVDDAATFIGTCDSMSGVDPGLRNDSTATAVLEDSELFSEYTNTAYVGPGFYDIAKGSGKVVAEHDAWTDASLPSYGPLPGQVEPSADADTSNAAEDQQPHAQLTVSGPVTSSSGVRGVGTDTVSLVSDLGLDEAVHPTVYLQDPRGARRRISGSWVTSMLWQAKVRSTPRTLPGGWWTVEATGGASCASEYPAVTAPEVVHLDPTPIVPTLTAAAGHGRRVRLAWAQRGEQAGTVFAVRSRVERGGALWRKPAALSRLAGHGVATVVTGHRSNCYEVRAKLFGTKSAWSARRCV